MSAQKTVKLNGKIKNVHYHSLDLLRGVAALAVVLWHYQHFYRLTAVNDLNVDKTSQPFFHVLSFFYTHGHYAVELFWLLSGFVLAARYFSNSLTIFQFLRNRFARLYPLHLLTLFMVMVLQVSSIIGLGHYQIYPINDLKHLFLNIFGIPFIGLQNGYSFNGPVWSVSVEIIAYIIFGVFLTLMQKNKSISFIIFILSIILLSLPLDGISYVIRESLVFFWAGVALFALYQEMSLIKKAVFATGLLAAYFILQNGVFLKNGSTLSYRNNPMLLTLLFGGVVFLICATEESFPTITDQFVSFANWIGNLTYSTYLLHVPLQIIFLIILQTLDLNQIEIVSHAFFFVIYFALLIMVSRFTYLYFESPMREKLRFKS
jgi:peptidoglycan/LPS O-acetylase OafA/YrhL